MDFEKYTDRSKQLIQATQTLALRSGNPQITAEHLLTTLLDDREKIAEEVDALTSRLGGEPMHFAEPFLPERSPAPSEAPSSRPSPAPIGRSRF